jgi:adenylosuccinate synthase
MSVTAVVGAQWGDEGKGRLVDYLAQRAAMVIRFQGGDNAGHSVVNERGTFRLHLVPSGIFNPETRCIVGPGAVVNPDTILEEMKTLAEAGVSLDNLWLSERAHVVLPYHKLLDGLEERARGGGQIGTTQRGIGPAYADKSAREGIRLGDLRYPDVLRARLAQVLERKNRTLSFFGHEPLALDDLLPQCAAWQAALGERIVDSLPMVRDAVRGGENVLLEGQLGVMRDLDWGIYPFVTSSNPLAGGACAGAGIPPSAITQVIAVVKAYSTCVGAGPFPVELDDEDGRRLREIGQEYGATTGRPRRCGWFDAVAIAYGAWLNGFSGLAVTKLDVLDEFDEIKLCTAYRVGERIYHEMPDTTTLAQAEPMYETWPGWRQSTREIRRWADLPAAARAYLERIASLAGVPIQYVSVGPAREQLVVV